MHNLYIEGLCHRNGRHKSNLMYIGRLSEKLTLKLGFKGYRDIDCEKKEKEIASRRYSNCQISQDEQINIQYDRTVSQLFLMYYPFD